MADDKSKEVRGWEGEKVRKYPHSKSQIGITLYLSSSTLFPSLPVSSIYNIASNSEPRSGAPFTESHFTGCVFGDVFLELFTPQGLKCPAAAIQRIHPGKIRILA